MKRIFALVLAMLTLAIALCGCVDGVEKETVGKETIGSVEEDSVPETTKAPEKTTFTLNETAVFENIKITANEISQSAGKEYFEAEEGNVFVGIKFTIENVSDEEQNISSMLLFDAYADGIKCDYSITAQMAFDNGTLDGEIAAGKKMVGYYAVEVSEDWEEMELQVKADWLSKVSATFAFENK